MCLPFFLGMLPQNKKQQAKEQSPRRVMNAGLCFCHKNKNKVEIKLVEVIGLGTIQTAA
jgi:hypothetical protein